MQKGSLNKVILIGRLGKDPEGRYTPSGVAVASFSLATNESWNNKEGSSIEHVEWHRLIAWGKLARPALPKESWDRHDCGGVTRPTRFEHPNSWILHGCACG